MSRTHALVRRAGIALTLLGLAAVVAAAPGERVRITGDVVNLRAGPSTGERVVGRVFRGDILVERGREGDWIGVAHGAADAAEAWVYAPLTEPAATTGTADDAAGDGDAPAGVTLSGSDNAAAVEALQRLFEAHGYTTERRGSRTLIVAGDEATFAMEPKLTEGGLDRVVVAQFFRVKPAHQGSRALRDYVRRLGERYNVGQFMLSGDGAQLIFQTHLTFVDRLEWDEMRKFLDFAGGYVVALVGGMEETARLLE